MMKLAFALAVLFYLCYSAPISPARHDLNLNNQMIMTMKELMHESVTFPSGFMLSYPEKQMIRNASNCVRRFISELEQVLQSVIVPERSKHLIEGLKANLKELESIQGNAPNTNATCNVAKKSNNSLPFNQYFNFMRKLNSSSKK